MSSLKEVRELLVDFYNYDGDISNDKFVLLYDEIYWALCCSKVNVRRSTEPICDLRIAKFSQFHSC